MEHSIGRVFIAPKRVGKLAAPPVAGRDCLEVAGLVTFGPAMGVSMPNYSKGRRKDGDRHQSLNESTCFRTLCLPDKTCADCCQVHQTDTFRSSNLKLV